MPVTIERTADGHWGEPRHVDELSSPTDEWFPTLTADGTIYFGSDRAGGVGMNAFTSSDMTGYFFSMPSNRFELWAYLESERFRHPVYRQFYKERDVVVEERRMRTESSPIGRLVEEYLILAHPLTAPPESPG